MEKENPKNYKFCGESGTDLSEAEMYCTACHDKYTGDEKFCTERGNKLIPMKEHLRNLDQIRREKKNELENKERESRLEKNKGQNHVHIVERKYLKMLLYVNIVKKLLIRSKFTDKIHNNQQLLFGHGTPGKNSPIELNHLFN